MFGPGCPCRKRSAKGSGKPCTATAAKFHAIKNLQAAIVDLAEAVRLFQDRVKDGD